MHVLEKESFRSINGVIENNFKSFKEIIDHIVFNLQMISDGAVKRRGTKRYFDAAIRSGHESDKARSVNATFDNTNSRLSISLVRDTKEVAGGCTYQMQNFDTKMLTEIRAATRAWIDSGDVTL